MAGPWEQYQQVAPASGPWQQYQQSAPQQSVLDKLLGVNGPRYQTWPERMVREAIGAAALPGEVVQEARQPKTQVSDSDVSAMSVPSVMGLATLAAPVNPAVRSGDKAIAGASGARMVPESKVIPPSAQQLKDAATRGYDAARNMGVEVWGSAVGGMARAAQTDLEQDGIIAELAPKTFAIIKKITNPPEGATATIANMEAIRRALGNTARDFSNPTEQLAASRVIKRLDQFLEGMGPGVTVARSPSAAPGVVALPSGVSSAGRPEAVSDLLRTARQNYGAAQRSNAVTGELDRATTGILERAENRAQAANSGRNLDNTIRSKIASILEKPKEVSGFSDNEIAALNNVLQGGRTRNVARYIGNRLGGGGGSLNNITTALGVGGGAFVGGVPGALIGATVPEGTGMAARTIANILAKRSLRKADETIRSNSPLFREMLSRAPKVPASLETKAAIARLLLMAAMAQGNK